jgi:hypothetical protein
LKSPECKDLLVVAVLSALYQGPTLSRAVEAQQGMESRARIIGPTELHRKSRYVLGYPQPSLRDSLLQRAGWVAHSKPSLSEWDAGT